MGQLFMGVGYHLDALRAKLRDAPPDVRDLLERTRAQVDTADREAHRAVWSLRATAAGSLREAIEGVVADSERNLGISVQLSFAGAPPPSGVIEHEVPRILQEALTNSVKHGAATRVTVQVSASGPDLVIRVHDDGSGFAPTSSEATPDGGFGLVGMRERAAQCGGSLTIESDDDGTTLTLTIPKESLTRLRDRSR
jgi:signal transduction histidine kinase